MKKILILVFLIFINFNFSDKTIVTNYKEFRAKPSTCTNINNCESLLINDKSWFEKWREEEVTKTSDGETRDFANVLFLVDVSGSMQNNKELSYIKVVIENFIDVLKPDDVMGIANYNCYAEFAGNVILNYKYNATIRKEMSTDKNFDDNVLIALNIDEIPQISGNAFAHLSNEIAKTSNWSYDTIIWLTDSLDSYVFETLASGSSLKDYGIKLYMVNIGNPNADIAYFGKKTKETVGKYYFVDTTQPLTEEEINDEENDDVLEENKCDSKEYAEKNAGECCEQYPDTCRCDNEAYAKRNPELCNDIKCVGFNDTELGKLLQQIFSFVQIGVVAILILTGTIDFVKAASSKDEQQMKKFQNDFVKRLIVGAVIFFVPAIINFVFSLLELGGTCGIK